MIKPKKLFLLWVTTLILIINFPITQAASAKVKLDHGLVIESRDKVISLRIGGRIQGDVALYDNQQTKLGSGTEVRRSRLFISGSLPNDWRFRTEYDFAHNEVGIKDAWIGYQGLENVSLKFGNIQEPLGLEQAISSNNTTFMERALPNALLPGYKLGSAIYSRGKNWSVSGGIFGDSVAASNGEDDEGWGLVARLTAAPHYKDDKHALHVGVAAEVRKPNEQQKVRYRARPESHVSGRRLVDTRTIKAVDKTMTRGLEAAIVQGPWSLQGEYIHVDIQRDNAETLALNGWYIYGSWLMTGESRRYRVNKGSFRPIKPKASYGAWELALRYSRLDLSDKDVHGGKQSNATIGMNWYASSNVRLMMNYIHVRANPNRDGVQERPKIIQGRIQLVF